MAAITLRDLTRKHRGAERPALDRLSLDVEAGEIVVLVGPSGCGKSTALRLIAGLDEPDAGSVSLGGRDLAGVPPQDRDVAMVFQGYALYPHLSVRDNIGFPLKMRGVSRATRDKQVNEAAATLGLSPLLDRKPSELSGGERQRVAMGRAIVRSPKAFLFDEPLSNLDAALRAELRVELSSLVRRLGVTSIYVTHDQVEAMTMGDRIAVMRAGTLQQIGKPREIYESPANVFVATFVGTPPMSLIKLTREGDRVRSESIDWKAPAQAGEAIALTAGLRPEALHFCDRTREGFVTIEATVVATEPLGAETIVTLDASGTRLLARAAGFSAPDRGATAKLEADPAAIHWFDTSSGERLRKAT